MVKELGIMSQEKWLVRRSMLSLKKRVFGEVLGRYLRLGEHIIYCPNQDSENERGHF